MKSVRNDAPDAAFDPGLVPGLVQGLVQGFDAASGFGGRHG